MLIEVHSLACQRKERAYRATRTDAVTSMENQMTHQQARRRLFLFAEQVKELKQSLSQMERSVQNLLKSAPLPLSGNEMQDACNQIDFGEFISKLSTRAKKTLWKIKIKDSVSLAGLTVFQLQCVTNCGETTVAAIVGRFAEYGIALPEDVASPAPTVA